jgi:hypothetical protein
VGFLPGKRESRRYLGDHVLTQNDVRAGGRFPDLVAYGGWSMDDHHPAGFRHPGKPTIFHPAPSPYGIPYRSLVARGTPNLMFAGRCHSATHMAMSSTRVMGTGCSMGQAAGTAAAMAVARGLDPAGMLDHVDTLQQALLRDDAYLPGVPQRFGPLTRSATLETSQGHGEPVRDGVNRPVAGDIHAWRHGAGDWIAYRFPRPAEVREATLLLDSALHLDPQMSHWYALKPDKIVRPPAELPHTFRVSALVGGRWQDVARVQGNGQRLVRVPVNATVEALRYRLECTWAPCEATNLYGFYVDAAWPNTGPSWRHN